MRCRSTLTEPRSEVPSSRWDLLLGACAITAVGDDAGRQWLSGDGNPVVLAVNGSQYVRKVGCSHTVYHRAKNGICTVRYCVALQYLSVFRIIWCFVPLYKAA